MMTQYNPGALADQWKDLKSCVDAASASSIDAQSKTSAIQNCSTNWLVQNTCIPNKGYTGVGPKASSNPTPPKPPVPIATFTGPCLTLYNNCIAAGGTTDVCSSLATKCSASPDGYCPPQPPACGPGIGNCPNSKMTWNAASGEYDITTHPNINQWGVQNTAWSGGSQWMPDYVAQKMSIDNRCEQLNDFDIKQHKDFVDYIPKTRYAQVKARADSIQNRLATCESAFQGSSCVSPLTNTSTHIATAATTAIPSNTSTVEAFDTDTGSTTTPATVATSSSNIGTDTATDDDSCGFVDDAGMTFDIRTHKQFPSVIQNYTSNDQLSSVCPRILDCATYPIENNKDIGKYVLRSSVPPTPAGTCFTNLQDSPDFATYQSTWQAKADLAAKTAKDAADASCTQQIAQYASKDPCGNPTACKTLSDYALEDHPGFPAYTQAWKDKLVSFAGRDANGNVIKCPYSQENGQSIDDLPAVTQLKADVAQCQSNLANCIPKDKCLTSSDFSTFDITRHPDIKKYVLRTSVPDINAVKKCRKKLGENKATYEQTLADQKATLEKTLSQYACKDSQGNYTACANPNMTNYILKSDVKPCPGPPSDSDISQMVKKNVCKYLDKSSMNKLCTRAGFSQSAAGRRATTDDSCSKHFLAANDAGLEGFTDQCSQTRDVYPEKHSKPADKWDVMLHKDYKYSDKKGGHMPKKECYGTYAYIDKSGTPLPYSQAYQQSLISDHPQYEATLMKYGAIKDKCGKLIPPPACPCLVRDQCGNLVPEHKAKPDNQKNCSIEAKCDASLMKEKLRFNILLARYKDLLKSVSTDKKDKSQYDTQLNALQNQLQNLQSSISQSVSNIAQTAPAQVPATRPTASISNLNPTSLMSDWDMESPLASAKPGIHGWNYT